MRIQPLRWLGRAAAGLFGLLVAGVVAWFSGIGPWAVIPGGVLWGEVRDPPADWAFTDSIAEVQVQTHVGPLPWSVTTWVLSHQGRLFLAAGECERVWTRRVKADPEIRVRIDGTIYELRADHVTDRALGAALAPVVLHKYMGVAVETGNWIEGATNGCVFAVSPRR